MIEDLSPGSGATALGSVTAANLVPIHYYFREQKGVEILHRGFQ